MKKVLFLLMILTLVSCKKGQETETEDRPLKMPQETFSSGFISIACDENFEDLIETSVQVFEAQSQYQALINVKYVNEKEAVRLLVDDSVRMTIVTRDLYPQESMTIKEKNSLLPRKFIMAFDGVGLIANKNNPDSLISMDTFKKILKGEITTWKQINPASPLDTIRLIFDNKESGVLRYVADSVLMGDSNIGTLYALNNYREVLDRIVDYPGSLGVMSSSILSDETNSKVQEYLNHVRFMRVSSENKATLKNCYLPYQAEINREMYPMWRPIYAIITDPKSGLPSGFTHFLTHEVGQKIILHHGLMPITDPQNQDVRIIDAYPD
jgi:hypothetical protein